MPKVEDESGVVMAKAPDEPPPRRRPKKVVIPRRAASVVVPGRKIIYVTADKTTCAECTCFPKEDSYRKPKPLYPCQQSPLTLYELAAIVVDKLFYPEALSWSTEDVANWIADDVGLPEYRECILDNQIDGMRLLMLEDPSKLPQINIRDFKHIQMITSRIRQLYNTEMIQFARSIGLPPRKPITHSTWFKSRTGPTWGIRQNWSRYQKPDYPRVLFARIPKPQSQVHIPHYKPCVDICAEYTTPRKFRLQRGIADEDQFIWMEHRPGSPFFGQLKKTKVPKRKESRLEAKMVDLSGLTGKDLILARRKMNRPKFLALGKSVKRAA